MQPRGNSLGYLEGVGRQIEFIDQDKPAPYVHQYSFDINREIGGNMAVGFEYSGSTIRNASLGGANDATLNINQLDPTYLSLGASLQDQVPNPFFGLPQGQGVNVNSPTITRAQLLRPFPQYLNILMRQNTQGDSQYHAAIFKFEKRMCGGWGGRINYTYSRLKDNFFAETNTYSTVNQNPQNSYDVAREYAVSVLDVPHKLVLSPIWQLPFGEGKKWATSGAGAAILGDWTISSIIAFESGFPISLSSNSNNLSQASNGELLVVAGTVEPQTWLSGEHEHGVWAYDTATGQRWQLARLNEVLSRSLGLASEKYRIYYQRQHRGRGRLDLDRHQHHALRRVSPRPADRDSRQ